MRLLPALVVLLLVAPGAAAAQTQAPVTAQQVIDRIESDFGTKIPAETVDTYKAGGPSTVVTGIATTFLPTIAVLRAAVAQGKNLILTHEPTFYNHADSTAQLAGDPVYAEKLAYIQAHHLVIFRLHDTMHMAKPDRVTDAFVQQAGWRAYMDDPDQRFFTLPPTTVQALAQDLSTKFHAEAIRVVGNPDLRVTHVALRVGAAGVVRQVQSLEHKGVEVLVAGEASEWETVEYVRDAALEGRPLALILLGHEASEEVGMKPFAARVQQLFPSLPVSFLQAGEPYWPLDHPRPLR